MHTNQTDNYKLSYRIHLKNQIILEKISQHIISFTMLDFCNYESIYI